MNYKVKTIPNFDRSLKRLTKKYPSLKAEYVDLLYSLEVNPMQGTLIGKNCYKIRLSVASKGKGKSGGARVITFVVLENSTVILLDICDKSEQENISDSELNRLIEDVE